MILNASGVIAKGFQESYSISGLFFTVCFCNVNTTGVLCKIVDFTRRDQRRTKVKNPSCQRC